MRRSASSVAMATASITRNHRKLEVYLYIKIHENTKSSKKNNRAENRMKPVTPSGGLVTISETFLLVNS